MRLLVIALAVGACSSSDDPASRPTGRVGAPADPATGRAPTLDRSQGTGQDRQPPGGTGVDEHGNLLRSKPDPSEPRPDPALVVDDPANLLFYAGALVGEPTLQRRVWQQLGLADAAGAPTPRMTEFIRAHQQWVQDRPERAQTVATPAKARAHLDAHLQ